MPRCEVCDLELDEVERFCPGCGVPAPRRVVEVSTVLRESFHSAAGDDEDTEYAFGTKRVLKTAPPPPPDPTRAPRERGPKARKTARPPEHVPSQPQPEPLPAEPEPEPVVVLEPEPVVVLEPEPVVVLEPDPEVRAAEVEPMPVLEEEPDVQEIEPVEGADLTENERTLADEPEPAPAPAPVVVPASAEPEPIKPYVVLPVRRVVAVRQPELVAQIEEVAGVDVPKRGGWKVVVLVLVLLAGAAGAYVLTGRGRTPTGGPFTAEARDGAISLDAPAGWRLESRDNGVLGIGEAAHDAHVHATAIRRSALAGGLSLKRRAEQVHEEFIASLSGVNAAPAETTKVGPYAAIRQVLSTDSVTYVHTVVKMPTYFVNVLAWTSAERFHEEQDELLAVVATLQSSG